VGRAADWLREERRRTLGDWVAFCLACGHAQRYFAETENWVPASCPQCAGEIRLRCPDCGSRIASMFAVACEACGGALRPSEGPGGPIRRRGK
jgi:ribosomal protein S27E